MPDPRGFLTQQRVPDPERDPAERTRDFKEIFGTLPEAELQRQGSRCMDCGVPFCNNGCPLGNLIPDWNDLVRDGHWREAIDQLHATNNFPEFTGLICPAPCESACVLDIDDDPVMIKQIEWGIIERAFREGWVVAKPPEQRTGATVGVVGSGPAGMAVAAELNQSGHTVTVYERDEAVGGLIRFGVPDHKLEKWMIDRRADLLREEGIEFECGVDVGVDLSAAQLRERHDAVVIAVGSRVERDLEIEGRELYGVHYAMDYLYQRNRQVAREEGIEFECGVDVGVDVSAAQLGERHDAVVIAVGSRVERDLEIEGRDLDGVHYAMDYLYQRNRQVAREDGRPAPEPEIEITAAGKNVVVIGGGDTGMDCVSNATREGAKSVAILDVYPELPVGGRYDDAPWPVSPRRSATTYALDEGGERRFGHQVTELRGEKGRIAGVSGRRVTGRSSRELEPVPGSEFTEACDLLLIAIGFTGPAPDGLLTDIGVDLDGRGNVKASTFSTSVDGVFAAGDARIGASLIVTAIAEGRRCARVVDRWLGAEKPAAVA